jgi:ParB family chromosome partitioning protein
MTDKRGLGRGLGALLNERPNGAAAQPPPAEGQREKTVNLPRPPVQKIQLSAIRKGSWQPRKQFEAEALADLAQSIKAHGVLQPLLVRALPGGVYELIAGERRMRAAGEAGLAEVPAIVMEATDRDAMELALIENLQREDLNPMEEAAGYRTLVEKFGMTQEQVAERVGKARASVANALRLLELPKDIRDAVSANRLSAGHAKVLSGLEIEAEQLGLATRAVKENLSVRNLERIVQRLRRVPRKPRASRADLPETHLKHLLDKLHAHFGTSVRIIPSKTYANGKKGKGWIEIDYYSNDELDRLLQIIGIVEQPL